MTATTRNWLAVVLLGSCCLLWGLQSGWVHAQDPGAIGKPEARASTGSTTLDDAAALLQAGRSREAEVLARALLADLQRELGPDAAETAPVLDLLVEILRRNGMLDIEEGTRRPDGKEVRQFAERALAVRERAGAPPAVIARSLTTLGRAAMEAGDPESAKGFLLRALSVAEAASRPVDPSLGPILDLLGWVERRLDHPSDARRALDRAIAIAEQAYGLQDRRTGQAYFNRAIVAASDSEEAIALYERAADILTTAVGAQHSSVRAALNNISQHYQRMAAALVKLGQDAAAVPLLEKSVTALDRSGANPTQVAAALRLLATALVGSGDHDRAIETALRSEALRAEFIQELSREAPERQVVAAGRGDPRAMQVALSLSASRPTRFTREVWDAVIRTRAFALEELMERRRAVSTAGTLSTESNALIGARERLSALLVRGPAGLPAEQYETLLYHARREKEQAEQVLAAASVGFRDVLGRRRLGIDDVSAVLPDDAALMAFVQYDHAEWSDSPPRVRTVPSYLAFVLTSRTEAPIVVRLGPTAEIDELVSRMRREVQRPAAGSIGVSRLESDYRVVAGALRRRVWDPLAVHLGKARRVFIVPDGALQLVDFAALPDRADRYLVESGPVIHYLSAERDLVPSPAGRNTEGLLAIGAPAFDDPGSLRPSGRGANAIQPALAAGSSRAPLRSECGGLEAMRFDPLPATAREVSEIGSLWRTAARQRSGRSATGAVTELGGVAASELAFKTQSPGKRVLHLATHGFFLDGLCAPARATAGAPNIAVEMTAYEHPLLVSGLVLAGANQRSRAGASDEDGVLTAEEIAGLNLDGVEWAVLSACSTGLGEIKAREGVFGLRRAFQIAGVRTVIMSLWQVDDEGTRQWMRALYQRRFTANRSTADAVRDASLTILGTRRAQGQDTHPFYWAGFVAAGDWR